MILVALKCKSSIESTIVLIVIDIKRVAIESIIIEYILI